MLYQGHKLVSLRSCTYLLQGPRRYRFTSGAIRAASSNTRRPLANPQPSSSTTAARPTKPLLYNLREYLTDSGELTADPSTSSASPAMSGAVLTNDDGPLIWIDCEMTGLNPDTDRLLEIAVIITDGRLEPVHEGIEYIIQTPKEVLDRMDEWCTTTHGNSGLTQSCIDSPHTLEYVSEEVLKYVTQYVPERGAGLLAGSSVHADMRFLYKHMPGLLRHLSYRILDVSSVKEICKRWYPSVRDKERDSRTGKIAHRALDDIQASIRELKFYQERIFKPLEPPAPKKEATEESTLIETFNKAL